MDSDWIHVDFNLDVTIYHMLNRKGFLFQSLSHRRIYYCYVMLCFKYISHFKYIKPSTARGTAGYVCAKRRQSANTLQLFSSVW